MIHRPNLNEFSSPLARLRSLPSRFRQDASGATAIMFALTLVPVLLSIGVAIDYSRATDDRAAIQRAVDAAVIAAARQHTADADRINVAQQVFRGSLTAAQQQQVKTATFTVDANNTRVTAHIDAETPTSMLSLAGVRTMAISAHSEGIIAKPRIRQLDLVMCIDASALNAVKTNALDFEFNLNAYLQRRGIDPFDAMRVRVIFFRDYGGSYVYRGPAYFDPNNFPSDSPPEWGGAVPIWQQNNWVWVYPSDPNRFRYVGDNPPMRASQFWNLPTDQRSFSSFVQPETAWGGGDPAESGLECVNEAIDSPWARVGDLTPKGKRLDQVYPVIAVWTMSETHPPGFAHSLLHPAYPSSMPNTHAGLLLKWNNATRIDQANRMLVFFGSPERPLDGASDPNGWAPLTKWPGFMIGGTLDKGTTDMVGKIADAVAAKLSMPVLSH